MNNKDCADLLRYATNLFAYPNGYFSEHTAGELGVSEAVREELIEMQNAENKAELHRDAKKRRLDDFVSEFFE